VEKRTERLKKSLEQERVTLRTLIDNLPDGIFMKDRESRFTFANRVIAEMMGASDPLALTGKTDHDFYSKEVADALLADEQVVIKTHQASINKEESKSPVSGARRVLTTKVPLIDARGEVTGLLGITRDITERHETEERLRRSEQRYRDLLEQAADGIFLLGENYNFLMANAEFCKMSGYMAEELLGLNILDTYPRELRDAAKVRNAQIKAGEKMRFERPMKRKDGSVFPVEMSARKLADGTMQGIAHDITERKHRESELALERSLLGALMESIPDYIYFKDTESRFIRTSKAHARAFGLRDAKEAIGKTDMDFFSKEHARKAYDDEQHIIRTGEPILNVEEKETWPNRPDTWALTTKMPLRDQEGNIIGSFGITRDITELRHLQQNLEQERSLLRTLIDSLPDYVYLKDRDSRFILTNKAQAQLVGASDPGELIGRTDYDFVPKELADRYRADDLKIMQSGIGVVNIEEPSKAAGGGLRKVLTTKVPISDAAGAVTGLVGISRDVTEFTRLQEQLQQAQKMEAIGQLTGGIAHDFNNVLQAITGYCEVLTLRLPDEENLKYVAEITKAAHRAAALTAQLLAFSRKQILRPQIVNTKDLIRSMHMMLERVIGEDIELRTLIDPNTGNFLADPGQMEQILLNLAVNARDAMPLGGKLTIETESRTFDEAYVHDHPGAKVGEYVRIAVSDTGVGMDQETLLHLYEPFFTTKEIGKGTGLGLATVYGIVKQSEGYINCYSELGRGTTFTIYLPLTIEGADKSLASMPGTTAPRGTETILLVDDDSAVRSVTRITLEKAGYVVIEASGGDEALANVVARNTTVALLVTDVVMPRMGGKELARRLQEISPKVRVLYASGYTTNVISHHGILEAGVDYLQKPFSSFEFLTKVREILDRP
jgi:PAS domain S-box-containing protein